MFVPSEAIYSDLVEHFDEVVQKAHRARVVIVSPTLHDDGDQRRAGDPARRAHARRSPCDPGRGRQARQRRAPARRARRASSRRISARRRRTLPASARRAHGSRGAASGSRRWIFPARATAGVEARRGWRAEPSELLTPSRDSRRPRRKCFRHGAGPVAHQEGGQGADVVGGDQPMLRRALGGMVEQFVEVLEPGGGTGRHRSRRDGVDPDSLAPELGRHVGDRGFERPLDRTHDAILLNRLLSAIVGDGEQAAAGRHQGLGELRHSEERMHGDEHGVGEALRGAVDHPAVQVLRVGRVRSRGARNRGAPISSRFPRTRSRVRRERRRRRDGRSRSRALQQADRHSAPSSG